ncbi:cation:proton antiporter [Wolbachia endosymbiont of Cruorifilaria tuberocauda]|uniref:proton-conducting transporter transmembrane domain-containing protein n=1 Tax=Wolbachia endosymbiont of Cruorifilaria tuberocauda TaxID=1812111 RepID=UPI00158BD663|nr:proton-conducting transporter membrane subunit [Wolbachia endosymbiont of Cruorifilaria tuberocauda]QKX01951.1 cation:proton antiporter [Wolbachia endosymbiont of Cruorifilaria tuberocauda]
MKFYKFQLLLLLAILIAIVLVLPEGFGTPLNWSYPILNFDLSFRIILTSFLSSAFLIILSAENFSFPEMLFSFAYTINVLCVILSNQVILVIVFCELMAISSSFIIADSRNAEPALRYACIHFFAGTILTAGLATQISELIIVGLLINCACFPFSFWVVDAYPAASLHGTAYLSLFTTKVSFLVMLLHTCSTHIKVLAFFGSITVVYSIVFASLEQDIRRFLCYYVVGQMGLLIIAGSLLSFSKRAVPILTLHIVFSLFYQSLLFVVANSIISKTKIISFSRASRLISTEGICAVIAVLTMAGFPGTAGFISKSCIMAEIEMNGADLELYKDLYKALSLLLYLSVGPKFIYYIFIIKSKLNPLREKNSRITMIILALICIVAGNPYLPIYNKSLIFSLIYNINNVWSQFNLLLLATLLFIPLRRFFLPRVNFKMDIDWIFRFLIPNIVLLLSKLAFKIKKISASILQNLADSFTNLCCNSTNKLKEVLDYNSVSFVSASSLFLVGILLALLCLNL